MTMPNKTYELRKLYFEQSQYSAKQVEPDYQSLLQWPEKGYFEKFKLDAKLLQKALSPLEKSANYSIADQVFGNQKESEYLGLKHLANLFYERCKLHKQHIKEIDSTHINIQEKLFGAKINAAADKGKRLSNLEGQLLQLETQRRDEELAFWKDTVELRGQLFEGAVTYKDANHRHSIFSDVEEKYVR
jgi:hypothetical protein